MWPETLSPDERLTIQMSKNLKTIPYKCQEVSDNAFNVVAMFLLGGMRICVI